MKSDILVFKLTIADLVEVPQGREAAPEWAKDIIQRRKDVLAELDEDLGCDEQ